MKPAGIILISLSLILSSLLIAQDADAIGVSPSRYVIDFVPNYQETLTFTAINSQDEAIDVELYVKGPQAQYMTLGGARLAIGPKGTKEFQLTVSLPASIERPGINDNRVGVLESSPTSAGSGASVAVRTGVEAQVWVQVPYPGKYIEAFFDPVPQHQEGDKIDLVLQVSSLGSEVTTVAAKVEVYSGSQKLATVDAGSATLQPSERKALTASWDSRGQTAGQYRAVAIVTFDSRTTGSETTFTIGGLQVNILGIDTSGLKRGSVSKVSVEVESLWNEPLQNVFAEFVLLNKAGSQLASSKSPSQEVPANGRAKFETFLDLTSVEEEEGDLRVVVRYLDKSSEKTVRASLAPAAAAQTTKGTPLGLPIEYIVIIGVVAAGVVGAAIFLRRRRA